MGGNLSLGQTIKLAVTPVETEILTYLPTAALNFLEEGTKLP